MEANLAELHDEVSKHVVLANGGIRIIFIGKLHEGFDLVHEESLVPEDLRRG